MKAFLNYLLARMQEASTWRGLILVVTSAVGLKVDDFQTGQIVAAGVGLAGLIGMFFKDKTTKSDTVVKQ